MRKIIDIKTGNETVCPVFIGEDTGETLKSIWRPSWRQAVVIGDSNTSALFSGPIARSLQGRASQVIELSFPAGEENKNRRTKEALEDSMLDLGIDRTACVVAVGGGVVTDLAGFVAATYMRGIDHINVATSLLAQVDAAVGGKTGVDTHQGKNLIGAFHQPKAVLIDTAALLLLPEKEMKNGMAEVVKHAVIADPDLFERLDVFSRNDAGRLTEEILEDSIKIKARVVEMDEKEQGLRKVLNFGHTFGHAVEKSTDYSLPHGYSVSIGMVLEARLAERVCGFPFNETERLKGLLARFGLPILPSCPFDVVAVNLMSDKKNRDGKVHFALPKKIGEMDNVGGVWSRALDMDLLKEVYQKNVGR